MVKSPHELVHYIYEDNGPLKLMTIRAYQGEEFRKYKSRVLAVGKSITRDKKRETRDEFGQKLERAWKVECRRKETPHLAKK